ncbi:MAG: hypothetical protein LBC75_04920 [Fibromonadaceae bacterium]|jgi:uncharacterized protein (TIGR02145 family)|nr:hypothetical protein [Fibromonadaceae bacterium]
MARHTIILAQMLCISLLFSCASAERDNPFDDDGGGSCYGYDWKLGTSFIDSRDGKEYKTIEYEITAQKECKGKEHRWRRVWMAENLNYNASGSKCYYNEETYCTTYGKLYDFETAKTVCPSGWRLPSSNEWDEVGWAISEGNPSRAGRELRAASGWDAVCNNTGDIHGFSALPGGWYERTFNDAGTSGYWWTSTENAKNWCNSGHIYRYMNCSNAKYSNGLDAICLIGNRPEMLSVRCVQD